MPREGASAPVGTTAGMLAMVFKGRPHSQPSQPTVGGGVSPAIAQRVAALHENGGGVGVRVPPLPLRRAAMVLQPHRHRWSRTSLTSPELRPRPHV